MRDSGSASVKSLQYSPPSRVLTPRTVGKRQKGQKLKWTEVKKTKVKRSIEGLEGHEHHKPRQVGSPKKEEHYD